MSGKSAYGLDSGRNGGAASVISIPVDFNSVRGGSPCSSINL